MIRYVLTTVALLALASCGPTQADRDFHPKIVRLRSLLEHGVNYIDYSKALQSDRGDFEVAKEKMSHKATEACDKALTAAETFRQAWSDSMTEEGVEGLYETLKPLGAYKSERQFKDDIKAYQKSSIDDSFEVTQMKSKINQLIVNMILARGVHVVIPKLKQAEAATQ